MKILIIEDDSLKYNQIAEMLKSTFSDFDLVWKKSYQSGLKELIAQAYDLVLLDMSMHLYDKSGEESGGSFEKYAGQMMLDEIHMLDISTKVIVVTMFDVFADGKTLTKLKQELSESFNNFYIDSVYYNASETKWRVELKDIIMKNFNLQTLDSFSEVSLNVLLIDDSDYKIYHVEKLIQHIHESIKLTIVKDKFSALNNLQYNKYDLIIVDMLLPNVIGESPSTIGGEMLLDELYINNSLMQPNSILVLTEYADLHIRFRDTFQDIAAIKFDSSSEHWKESIKRHINRLIKSNKNERLIIYCEDQNDVFYNMMNFLNVDFRGLKGGSRSVYLAAKNEKSKYALRDGDYLTKNEIYKLKNQFKNYFILEYYCFENYLYHPDNIEELNIEKFHKQDYINEIINQKSRKFLNIVQDYKIARNSYTDFTDNNKKNMDKNPEIEIIDALKSDDLEVFYPYFDMKGTDKNKGFDASILERFGLTPQQLSQTQWIKSKISVIFSDLLKAKS